MRLVVLAMTVGACGFEHGRLREPNPSSDGGGDAPAIDATSIDVPLPTLGWRRRISWSGVTSNLTDFPLLVILDANRIAYADTQAGGSDLQFRDATSNAVLAHEIELWDPPNRSYIWVKVPLVDAAATRSIWMYYGDPQTTGTQNPPAVWSDAFIAVWHLAEPVADEMMAGTHADATGHGNTGLQRANNGELFAGGIAGVQRFDGTADMVEIPTAGITLANAVTIEVRAWCSVQNQSYPHVLAAGSDGRFWQVFWDKDTGDAGWAGAVRVAGSDERIRTAAGVINEWRSLAIVYTGAAVTLYMDGTSIGSTTASGTMTALDTPIYLGANPILGGRELTGYVDEFRISSVARSPAWLTTAHRAAADTLLTFAPPETL